MRTCSGSTAPCTRPARCAQPRAVRSLRHIQAASRGSSPSGWASWTSARVWKPPDGTTVSGGTTAVERHEGVDAAFAAGAGFTVAEGLQQAGCIGTVAPVAVPRQPVQCLGLTLHEVVVGDRARDLQQRTVPGAVLLVRRLTEHREVTGGQGRAEGVRAAAGGQGRAGGGGVLLPEGVEAGELGLGVRAFGGRCGVGVQQPGESAVGPGGSGGVVGEEVRGAAGGGQRGAGGGAGARRVRGRGGHRTLSSRSGRSSAGCSRRASPAR